MRFLSVLLTIIVIGTTALSVAQGQRKSSKTRRKSPVVKQQPVVNHNPVQNEFKVLFEDDQSSMEEPFIFVARSQEQYSELQKMVQNLSAGENIDWTQNAIIAVFAGQKPTSGFGIKIEKTTNKITDKIAVNVKVSLTSPPKDAITAQVLTAPVKIVLISVSENQGISVMPGANWRQKMQTFRVSKSEFESIGGFIGKSRKFEISGSIDVLRTGNWITTFFNVRTEANPVQGIFETATGTTENKSIVLPRIDAGNLVEDPHPALKATGKISEKDVSLSFESLPTYVADGFLGRETVTGLLIK